MSTGVLPYRAPGAGFTVIELVVVIVILGVLAAVALPKLAPMQDEAHTAHAQGVSGAFHSAVNLVHAKWLSQGGGANVPLEGGSVDVNPLGWPADVASPPMTQATCATLWRDVLQQAPTVAPGFAPGTGGWGALAGGALCGYVYQPDTAPIRIVIYNTQTGSVQLVVI